MILTWFCVIYMFSWLSVNCLFVHKIDQNVTKTWDQPYPPCPVWCSKKVELVRGINISYGWVWAKQGCRGEVGSFQLKSGFAIRGKEIGLDLVSRWWACRLRGSCHLKGTRDTGSAVFVSKHSKVRNPSDDGSSLLIEKKSCSIIQSIKRCSLETRECVSSFPVQFPNPLKTYRWTSGEGCRSWWSNRPNWLITVHRASWCRRVGHRRLGPILQQVAWDENTSSYLKYTKYTWRKTYLELNSRCWHISFGGTLFTATLFHTTAAANQCQDY